MSQPRILFVKASASPIGGVATWLDRAVPELAERGFDPVVGLVEGEYLHSPHRYREFHPNLDAVHIDGRSMNREGRVRACMRAVRATRPSMVVPIGVVDAVESTARCKAAGDSVHLVGRAQGNLSQMLADLQVDKPWMDHVVCVGRLTRELLLSDFGYSGDRVSHIPNGATAASKRRTPITISDPLRLVYVGRLTSRDKRATDLPRLCAELSSLDVPYSLTVVGTGPCEDQIKQEIRSIGGAARFCGPLPSERIYDEILPNADVLLLFSSSETFGIVLAEAMMHGVVPVTSQYLGFHSERLVVHDEHGLSYPVGEMSAAARCIARLHENRALLEQLSRNSLHHSAFYTWERCFDHWAEVLRAVIERPPVVPKDRAIPVSSGSGRLERLGVPGGLIDSLRRVRRRVFGYRVPPGGEEWPLYRKDYSADRLAAIEHAIQKLDAAAADDFELISR